MKDLKLNILLCLSFATGLANAQSTSNVVIGAVAQQATGLANHNSITIASLPPGNAVINDVVQQAHGSANSNLVSIHAANVSAGLLFQNATGHGSLNELSVGGSGASVSLGDIIQEAHNGEANVVRIGSRFADQ